MRLALLLLAVLAAPLASQAADVAVIVDDSRPGTYLVTVAADGSVTANPLRVVRPGTLPNPPAPPPATPFVLEVRKQTAAVLAAGGSKTTAAGLSAVYSLVADGVAEGGLDATKSFEAVKTASDMILGSQPDGAKWATFRSDVGKALTALRDGGKLNTKAEIVKAFREIAAGMNLATGFHGDPRSLAGIDPRTAGVLDGINLARIIELIKLVMELLKLFKGG